MAEAKIGRVVAAAAVTVVVAGAVVFFHFRYTFSAERLYQVQTSLGIDAPEPVRHILPAGFQGWASISYGIEETPPLESIDGVLIAEYPLSGQIETSTEAAKNDAFLNHEYFERTGGKLTPLNRLGQIWGEYHMRLGSNEHDQEFRRTSGFFVGSMAEFRATDRPTPGRELRKRPRRE